MAFGQVFSGTMGFFAAVLIALVILVALPIVGCTLVVGGCMVTPAVRQAREAAERARAREEAKQDVTLRAASMSESNEEQQQAVKPVEPSDDESLYVNEDVPADSPPSQPVLETRPPQLESAADEIRRWSDKTGKFSVDATFVSFNNGAVNLRKSDGSEITVKADVLSDEDRAWIAKRARR